MSEERMVEMGFGKDGLIMLIRMVTETMWN